MATDDPWDWSIDRVVQELCTPNRSWQPRSATSPVPDPTKLEPSLRENQVDGNTLLVNVNDRVLKEDFGLRVLAWRGFVTHAISELRLRSVQYQAYAERHNPHSVRSEIKSVIQDFLQGQQVRYGAAPQVPQGPSHQIEFGSSLSPGPGDPHEDIASDEPGSKRRKLDQPHDSEVMLLIEDGPGDQNQEQDVQGQNGILTPAAEPPAEPVSKGKKRKRIAPTLITSEIDPNRNREVPTAADNVIHNVPPKPVEPGVVFTGTDSKKRMAPIRLSETTSGELQRYENLKQPSFARELAYTTSAKKSASIIHRRNSKSAAESLSSGYLGKKAIPVDQIFYQGVAPGEELGAHHVDTEFYEGPRHISTGRRRYVHKMIKNFHMADRKVFNRGGKFYSAIQPYPERLAPKFQKPSFTLYYSNEEGEIHARREALPSWPEIIAEESSALQNASDERATTFNPLGPDMLNSLGSYDDWDPSYLEKYKNLEGGDEILPLYGESDEENEYDLATWKEMEEERGGKLDRPLKPTKRQHLNLEQINEGIDEGIAQLIAKWKSKVLPKREKKAWSLWTKSRKRGTKRPQIIAAQRDRGTIIKRIDKLRKEISTEVWTSKLAVQKQTGIMEINIFTREDLAWKISVLEQKKAPEKQSTIPSIAGSKKPTLPSEDGEDGESIGSEDDVSSSEDGIDDFIVPDGSLPSLEEEIELNLADSEDENGEDVAMSDATRSASSSPEPIPALTSIVTPSKAGRNERNSTPSSVTPRSPFPSNNDYSTPRLKDEDMSLPKLPAGPSNGSLEMIDLTIISSDDTTPIKKPNIQIDLITPANKKTNLKLLHRNSPFKSITINISDEDEVLDDADVPPYHDPAGIARYSHNIWEQRVDRDRLVIKAVYSMRDDRRSSVFDFIAEIDEEVLWTNLRDLLEGYIQGDLSVKGIDSKTAETLRSFARLFQIYVHAVHVPNWYEKTLPSSDVLHGIIHGFDEFFSPFFHLCCALEGYFGTRSRRTPGNDLAGEDNKDDEGGPRTANRRRPLNFTTSEDEILEDTPRKKKKLFIEDAEARGMREREQTRGAEQEERRKKLRAAIGDAGLGSEEARGKIIINDAALETQGFLYVNEHIAKRIKAHQIQGLRFLWNQVVTEDKKLQGCLLAHTMGLGKTMQVISLLVAIAEAAASDNETISSQIPERLRESRTLVLCPPTLIDNWMDELIYWVEPGLLGELLKIDASIPVKERLRLISKWHGEGGVLLLGYEMFRNYVANKQTAKKNAPLTEDQHKQLLKELVEGPNIVIADEAHKMKNAGAGITRAAAEFDTKCRIALTGSPLANNVEEYHTMIDWVAPNYLGPASEFREKYVEPIQTGLYGDSAPYEKRKALKMLGVLNQDLGPKVHRADMSVLKNDLPPKREFTITVSLTELQRKAYALYVQFMIRGEATLTKDGEVTQTTLWHWLAILSLLCNHPACFEAKLNERKEEADKAIMAGGDATGSRDATDAEENLVADIDPPIWKVGVSQNLINAVKELFGEEAGDIKSVELSNKALILCQILDAAKAAKDKTLVFSQSIPTLNFLENLCKRQGRSYMRLDGKTKMNTRQAQTKEFNNENNKTNVFLISTNAGSLGLNLPGANRVVIFDFKFNPIQEEQAIGRAYRIGQMKHTFVYRFVAGGTFEDSVHNKTIFKQQLASRVVDKKRPMAMAKKKLGDFLFEPKHVEQKDLTEFEGMDPLVLDKILAAQRESGTIRAIIQSDTFERDDDDKLTAEEEKEVKQMYLDEQLKRNDPAAYYEMKLLRGRQALAAQSQHAAVLRQATNQPTNPGVASAQQLNIGNIRGFTCQSVIVPPIPSHHFAYDGNTIGNPSTQAFYRSQIGPVDHTSRPEIVSPNVNKHSPSVAPPRGQSPISGSNIRVCTASPDPVRASPALSIRSGDGNKNATPAGSVPGQSASKTRILPPVKGKHDFNTPSRSSSGPPILPPNQANGAQQTSSCRTSDTPILPPGQAKGVEKTPSRSNLSTLIQPPNQANGVQQTPSRRNSNAPILPPQTVQGIEMTPSRSSSSTPVLPQSEVKQKIPNDSNLPAVLSGSRSRNRWSRLESLLVEEANSLNKSPEKATALYKEIKALVKQHTSDEQDFKSVMRAAISFLDRPSNRQALLSGNLTPDGFVRQFLNISSQRTQSTSSADQEEKVGTPSSLSSNKLRRTQNLLSQPSNYGMNGLKEPRESSTSGTSAQHRAHNHSLQASKYSSWPFTQLQDHLALNAINCQGTKAELIALCEAEDQESNAREVLVQESERQADEEVTSTNSFHPPASTSSDPQQPTSLFGRVKKSLFKRGN